MTEGRPQRSYTRCAPPPPTPLQGLTEEIIGRWHKQEKGRREKLVIAARPSCQES